jgi:hypothetical protein
VQEKDGKERKTKEGGRERERENPRSNRLHRPVEEPYFVSFRQNSPIFGICRRQAGKYSLSDKHLKK